MSLGYSGSFSWCLGGGPVCVWCQFDLLEVEIPVLVAGMVPVSEGPGFVVGFMYLLRLELGSPEFPIMP